MFACLLCSLLFLSAPACRAQQEDWQAQVRSRVAAHDLSGALAIADARLKFAPEDAEASAWRARILAWTQHWPEAEAEYRKALAEAPADSDVLSGLAQLLYWEQRYTESLELLDRARELAPRDVGMAFARARDLAALGRRADAEEAYRQAHELDPENPQAMEGLAALKGELRQELIIGNETDAFNYTDAANTQTVAWIAHWRWNWITSLSSDSFQRFGEQAEKVTASTTWRFTHSEAITLGGAAAHDNAIVPKSEAFLAYGRGFRLSEGGFLRGLEATVGPHWYWFRDARILTLTSDILLYLPRGWTWQVTGVAARSHFSGTPADWQPSGTSRLNFPLGRIASRHISGNAFYALGAEDYAQVDQIGSFSAHTYGSGVRFELTPRQATNFFAAYQRRTNGQTQASYGLSYELRF